MRLLEIFKYFYPGVLKFEMIYFRIENGVKKYTLNNENATIIIPAKFSIEDKNSDARIEIKRRYKIFPFDEEDEL